jgi:hypothetical protein
MSNTIKLNTSHRDAIQRKLIENKFSPREKQLVLDNEKLALDVYHATFSPSERKKMDELPVGWLRRVHTIRARLGGVDFGYKLAGKKSVPMPAEKCDTYNEQSTFLLAVSDGPLAVEARRLERETEAIKTEKEKLRSEIRSVLFNATTANRLITLWPEIKPVVDAVLSVYVVQQNLPAPRVEDLNKALGLKSVAA